MSTKKTVLLGISGSIAAYKIANLARMLKKSGYDVYVLMTENAQNFIHPLTLETLTQNKCLIDTFDRNFEYSVEHVSIAKKADVVLLAPASANVIGKIANGIADDMLTTTVMACTCKVIISPAMNHNMFHNPIVQDNINKLKHFGYEIIPPDSGMLANGDLGDGRMPDEDILYNYIYREIAYDKDLAGKKVLVTAGATCEAIDPVRYITNHSSGKMGYAVAKIAALRGAEVILVSGKVTLMPPPFISKIINVTSAHEMFEAVKANYSDCDLIVKAAAVADYRPVYVSDEKLKKSDKEMSIELCRTDDILKWLGQNKKENQVLCGFAMETQNMISNAQKKLLEKNLDMIAANNLKVCGAGFQSDTNVLTLITKENIIELPIMSKEDVASILLDKLIEYKTII